MSYEAVKRYFEAAGVEEKVFELDSSSITIDLAAKALGCVVGQAAKTMCFDVSNAPILIVAAGDAKIDNRKFREQFQQKARMFPQDEVGVRVGHNPGALCPFAVNEGVQIYLDISLKRFETIFTAAGNEHSAAKVTLGELEEYSHADGWVDVCKGWYDNKAE